MFLSGFCFAGELKTSEQSPTYIKKINAIELRSGAFDHFYGTQDITKDTFDPTMLYKWDKDTVFDFDFNGDLFGGNVNYAVNNTHYMKLQRRVKGSTEPWTILRVHKIEKPEDFNFHVKDNLNAANTWYEYALVPVFNGNDGGLTVKEVFSDFEGMYIVEKDSSYFGFLNLNIPQPIKHTVSSVVDTLNSRYPTIVNNNEVYYDHDTCSAIFVDTKEDTEWGWDFQDGWRYREQFKKWLKNGKVKLLKYGSGMSWLIAVIGDITDVIELSPENATTSFEWYEVGDKNSSEDLINFGLIDGGELYE